MTRTLSPDVQIRPTRLAHMVLRVRNLECSIAWYHDVVGMEVVHGNPKIAFMSHDEEHHRLALLQTPVEEQAPEGSPGLDHVAFAFDTFGDLLSTYTRLEGLGMQPYWSINHGPTTSFYYRDPDGNGVELFVDNFETEAELKGWMNSEAFAANPIGVFFDPKRLIERYEAGDALEDLVQQGSA